MFANKIVLQKKKLKMQGSMTAPDYFFSKPITTSGENGKKRLFWSHFDN